MLDYTHVGIDPAFDYFNGFKMKGQNTDNCPLKFHWGNGNCLSKKNKGTSAYYEEFGATSRCIEGDYMKSNYRGDGTTPKCLEAKCQQDGSVTLEVEQNVHVTCRRNGERKDLSHIKSASGETYRGYLNCPNDLKRFCISMN